MIATTVVELNWECYLLIELGIKLPQTPMIYCDNVGATHLCSYLDFHSSMKHVAIDFHFIRDQVQNSVFHVAHVSLSHRASTSRPLTPSVRHL